MNLNIKENQSNNKPPIVFDDSTLPSTSKVITVKRAKELKKTLGFALMNKFKNKFNLESYDK